MHRSLARKLSTACLIMSMSAMSTVSIAEPLDITHEKIFFLSPHPDDIALTFGGLINKLAKEDGLLQKKPVTEVYFSVSNYTTNHLDISTNKRVIDVTSMRFNEDIKAHTGMFNKWSNFRYKTSGFYDAPLRNYEGSTTAGGGPAGTFEDFRQQEIEIYQTITASVKPILQQDNCAAFVLLANGSHIDHFVVREAILKAAHDLGSQAKCDIYLGQDQPYTGANPTDAMVEVNNLAARLPPNALIPMRYWIDKEHKVNLFETYFLSQYDKSYIPALDSADTETIYKWEKSTYSQLSPHQKCNSEYCRW